MKYSLYFLVMLVALMCCCTNNKNNETMDKETASSVMIDDTTVNGLIVYYPQFSRIDLVCEKMPSQQDDSVVFCAEAAFTHEVLDEFAHSNIDGDHVSGG